MKLKKFTVILTKEDYLDVMLLIDKKIILKFALNYRAFINNKWNEVYRIDNFHGFLHEQKFWRSKKPIKIEEKFPLNIMVEIYIKKITMNFQRYRSYYEKKK